MHAALKTALASTTESSSGPVTLELSVARLAPLMGKTAEQREKMRSLFPAGDDGTVRFTIEGGPTARARLTAKLSVVEFLGATRQHPAGKRQLEDSNMGRICKSVPRRTSSLDRSIIEGAAVGAACRALGLTISHHPKTAHSQVLDGIVGGIGSAHGGRIDPRPELQSIHDSQLRLLSCTGQRRHRRHRSHLGRRTRSTSSIRSASRASVRSASSARWPRPSRTPCTTRPAKRIRELPITPDKLP